MRVSHLMAGVAVATVLVATGFAAGATGVVQLTHAEKAATISPVAVPYVACPERVALGVFHGGDRVFVTARTESSDWVQVRDPWSPDARVWVRSQAVRPDASLADLPVADCALPADLGTVVPTSEPATTEPGTTAEVTTTTAPTSTAPPSTVPSSETTAPPAGDNKPPSIGPVTADTTLIYENASSCLPGPFVARLTVPVNAPGSGVASVAATWAVGTATGSAPVSGSGVWTVTLGPFQSSTLAGGSAPVVVTISATDRAGNVAQLTDRSVVLRDCG